ncbi:hypothetical protein ACQY0O_005616 [Thecaphora frezii]
MKSTGALLLLFLSGFATVLAATPALRAPAHSPSGVHTVLRRGQRMVLVLRSAPTSSSNSKSTSESSVSGSGSDSAAAKQASSRQVASTLESLNTVLLKQIHTLNSLTKNSNGMDRDELQNKVLASLKTIQEAMTGTNKVLHDVARDGSEKVDVRKRLVQDANSNVPKERSEKAIPAMASSSAMSNSISPSSNKTSAAHSSNSTTTLPNATLSSKATSASPLSTSGLSTNGTTSTSSSNPSSDASIDATTAALTPIITAVSATVSQMLPPALDATGAMFTRMGMPQVAPILQGFEPLGQELAKVAGKIAIVMLPEMVPLGNALATFLQSLGVH